MLVIDPPQLPRKVKKEKEEEFEIRRQLPIEKFRSEINLQKKWSEKCQECFMKTDTEMIMYLTGHFKNNEVCDALIKQRMGD